MTEPADVAHALGPGIQGDWAPSIRVALQAGRTCGQRGVCLRRSSCQQPITRGVDYDGS
ncbi:hypothetical protein [Streptomyces sp. NPDC060065]|uniref:hypothetical protein n=1 Tax=Streptomyces sp. NPDC060065 TaxID=3347050 RepID=UPI003681CFFD